MFFVCLQVSLATDRDTQLVVCAQLCDQAEAKAGMGLSFSSIVLAQFGVGIGEAAALLPPPPGWHLGPLFGFAAQAAASSAHELCLRARV